MCARVVVVALVGLVGTLLGCGEDETSLDTTPAPTMSVETTVAVSVEQLDAMLLDASDVGSGWQLGPAITDADLGDASQIPCPDTAINPTVAARLTPVAGVQFEPVDHSSKHLIEFAVTGRSDRLDADLQIVFGAMDACASTIPATIATGAVTVQPFTIPELGDQRAAYALIGVESADATWYTRTADVRVGSVAVQVGLTEILQSPDDEPSISDDEFVQLVQTAITKVSDATTAELANPASQYCVERGGQIDIVDEADGQVGYCMLPDGRRIEEWEYYRSHTSTTSGP